MAVWISDFGRIGKHYALFDNEMKDRVTAVLLWEKSKINTFHVIFLQ